MNQIQGLCRGFKRASVAMLLLATSTAYAVDKDCWADFFEDAQYAGKHLFVEGATQLADLNNVNGDNWDRRIHSLKVGPKAKLTVYQNPRFELTVTEMAKRPDLMQSLGITEQDIKEDSELIFIANAKIHDLGDFDFHKKIRSLKLECL
ncbi:beta/gamma crystallin domain-containing protein [Crenothrix sp.]|uniref:beta/gamma crystallin domain-containing protein n=1 Tax=Crenothrix sp. TaxID=3100433 RepID=UPI00374DB04C